MISGRGWWSETGLTQVCEVCVQLFATVCTVLCVYTGVLCCVCVCVTVCCAVCATVLRTAVEDLESLETLPLRHMISFALRIIIIMLCMRVTNMTKVLVRLRIVCIPRRYKCPTDDAATYSKTGHHLLQFIFLLASNIFSLQPKDECLLCR